MEVSYSKLRDCEPVLTPGPLSDQGGSMSKRIRVLGQVLTAVGLTLAAGGIASFLWSNVELRFLGNILASERSRVVWIILNLAIAVVGTTILRGARKPSRP